MEKAKGFGHRDETCAFLKSVMHSREYVRPLAEPPRIRLHRVSPTRDVRVHRLGVLESPVRFFKFS